MSNPINAPCLLTIRGMAKKHDLPEHLLRAMCKRGELPGFFANSRFYVHEGQALAMLDSLSARTEASTHE